MAFSQGWLLADGFCGYNKCMPKGYKHTKITIEKLRKANLGKKQSEETKLKKSLALSGKKRPPFSSEWKNNISKGGMGRIPWNKKEKIIKKCLICGKEFSVKNYRKDTAKYCSRSCITKDRPKEIMKKLGKLSKGRKHSEEQNRNQSEIMKGEKCHFWKGGVTPENKRIRRGLEFRLWREAVFARDNWTCQKYGTRGGILHPHHIHNFSQYPELRFIVDNGITLSDKAHKEFHKKYGKQNNNKKQINEFISSKK